MKRCPICDKPIGNDATTCGEYVCDFDLAELLYPYDDGWEVAS